MRLRDPVLLILGMVLASAGSAALADTPAAAASTGGDVTMTVIPSGTDVVKSVVQNIVVPANANKVAKNKSDESQKAPAAEQTAQQLAEAAAVHQAGQTQQQVQQVAQQAQQQAQPATAATRKPQPPPGRGRS